MEEWLKPFGAEKIESLPASQKAFPKPRTIKHAYQASAQDTPKAYSAVNWVLYEHGDPELSMKATVLFHILTGTPASPLRKALIESGLGEDLAGFGISEELRQTAFSIGLKGVEPARIAEVESLIVSTLEELANHGIDANAIAASLNTIEFALREKNTGRFPRGLAIMFDALNEWLYEKDPIAGISFAEPLKKIKNEIELHPNFFGEFINSLLLSNTHRTTVNLLPSDEAHRIREEAEKDMLKHAAASLSPEDLNRIEAESKTLQQLQNTPDSPEALATIPMLSLNDIPKEAPLLPSEPLMLEGFAAPISGTAFYHDLSTGGILYLDLGFNFSAVPAELLPYVSLLGRFLLEMGTNDLDYVKLIQQIGIHTGGIHSATISTERWNDPKPLSMFFLRAKALPEKASILADILIDVLTKAHFDNIERVKQIVLEEKAQAESVLIPASARIVNLRLKSYYSIAGWASEQLFGIEHLFFLRKLSERIEREWPVVLREMETLRSALITKNNLIINVTADRATLNAAQGSIARIAQPLPSVANATSAPPSKKRTWIDAARTLFASTTDRPASETIDLPTQVNSVGMMLPLPGIKEQAGGALVASKYLDVAYLWEHVRVMGGAYGGYSSLDLASGLFSMLSYRDPNLEKTIGVYKKVAEYLSSIEVAPEEIQKSIIGTIGDIDSYQLPDAKGFNALMNELTGYSQQTRQIIRDQVLTANTKDLHRLGKFIESALPHSMIVALTSANTVEGALSMLPAPSARLSVN
jgi:Zn-dependent M16 (insulinase) family peptidase